MSTNKTKMIVFVFLTIFCVDFYRLISNQYKIPFGQTFLFGSVALFVLIASYSSDKNSNSNIRPAQPNSGLNSLSQPETIQTNWTRNSPPPHWILPSATTPKDLPIKAKIEVQKPILQNLDEKKDIAIPVKKINPLVLDSRRKSLHEKLYELRYELKKQFPNLVLNSNSISEIAASLPRNLAQLERITGIGQSRIHLYGKRIIEVVNDHLRSRNFKSVGRELNVKYMGGSNPGTYRIINVIRIDEKYFYGVCKNDGHVKTYLIDKVADVKYA